MALTTVEELFKGPWGIVADRRQEIEEGHFGTFERVYGEEVERHFLPIDKAAQLLDCCTSTARKYLWESDTRLIIRETGAHWFYKPDVEKLKKERDAKAAEVAAARAARAARKAKVA